MRIKIDLEVLQPQTIEINYNYYLSVLIYCLLRESDVDFSSKLHSHGYTIGNKTFKLFCFSKLILAKYSVNGDKLTVKDRMHWYISSPVGEFVYHLADGLLKKQKMNIGQGKFYIRSVEILKSPKFEGEMKFRSLSPITIHTVEVEDGERKTVSCAPHEMKFVENIKNNLLRKYFLLQGKLPDDMSIQFAVDEKYLRDRGKLIAYKDTLIKGYQVPFRLKCDSGLMEVAYDCGVGEKNSAGFGFIEVRR